MHAFRRLLTNWISASLFLPFLLLDGNHVFAQQTIPNEFEIEYGLLQRLPQGSDVVSFRHEVFADEARGVGRVSVSGTYVIDREYYITSDGFETITAGRAKDYGATKGNFVAFWQSAAYDFGGDPWAFKIAKISYRPGQTLKFWGDINYVRGVDGFRFSGGNISKEIPQGSSSPNNSYVPNSPEYNKIEEGYINFLKQLGGFCEVESFSAGTEDSSNASPTNLTDLFGAEQWKGSVNQPGARPYGIIISASDGEILVEYPELECGGLWKFDEVSQSKSWKFTERILLGKKNCVDNGEVEIFACKGGGIKFEWRSRNASAAEAWSLMTKQ